MVVMGLTFRISQTLHQMSRISPASEKWKTRPISRRTVFRPPTFPRRRLSLRRNPFRKRRRPNRRWPLLLPSLSKGFEPQNVCNPKRLDQQKLQPRPRRSTHLPLLGDNRRELQRHRRRRNPCRWTPRLNQGIQKLMSCRRSSHPALPTRPFLCWRGMPRRSHWPFWGCC